MSTRLLPRMVMMAGDDRDWLAALRVYLAASGILHLAWEVAQLPLYTIWRTGSVGEIAFAVLHCTAGDVMIATLVLVTALIAFGSATWPASGFLPVFAAVSSLGVGYTVYSEWLNTVVRKSWAYGDLMPTLPVLGTGLSPLLQWLIVPALALWIATRLCTRTGSARADAQQDVPVPDQKMQ